MDTPPPSSAPLKPGDRVGRYCIERVLGQGGMGVVYAARDAALGRLVALKVASLTDGGGSDSGKARLLREAAAAGALRHVNAVAVYDVGEHEGAPFFAMELVEGETLRQKALDGAPLATRIGWLRAVADALGAAHAKGIVHRDVKPENVMVDGGGVVKVLDFGIARRAASVDPSAETIAEGAALPTITAEGVPLGTPRYMAPEQLLGKPLDGRADQFSWGVLAHEILAGRAPWSETSPVQMVSEILSADPPALPDEVPAPVRAAIRRAMAKAPADRFASMGDLLDAMAGSAPATGEAAADPVAPKGTGSPPRRRRAWIAAAAAIAVVAAAGVTASRAWAPRRTGTAPGAARTAITDLPAPRSDKPQALEQYRAALEDLRAGSLNAAWGALDRATTLDPALGAAWVRWLAHGRAPDIGRDTFRRWYRAAARLRASLDERDRALLDAMEPVVVPDIDDEDAWERRMLALAARFPGDAEIAFLAGNMLTARGRFDAARAELGRALELDPGFAAAALAQAEAAAAAGDEAGLAASLARCFAVKPDAVGCLRLEALYARHRGDCAAYEASARRMIAVEPDVRTGYHHLFSALTSRGSRAGSLVDLQGRLVQIAPPPIRPLYTQFWAIYSAFFDGELDAATRAALSMQALEVGETAQSRHLSPIFLRMFHEETGNGAAEAALVRDVIEQKPSWIPDATYKLLGFLAPARRLGVISEDRYRALLASWIDEARAQLGPSERNAVWAYAYAMPARTREEAEAALAALPQFTPLPPDLSRLDEAVSAGGALGAVHELAGHHDQAIPLLERATARCIAAEPQVEMQRLRLLLGAAREARGDSRGACEAYARILEHWGSAKPRSVTADEAQRRGRALGCPGT